ncbi:hypothetical protein [Dyadobacter jiangsuensis]|uniref:Lipocalin-like protein n=1 Tax=Dyadobacter jiangsuensis TaxID=1591085 RepID=A0A2P8GJ56_9BACT|nr:hypothetical protein [Dyadobacter jiangsuensis]PSL33987.1 hypothetical protein CLV60_101356 [Dyadobacter jiangsuensis]
MISHRIAATLTLILLCSSIAFAQPEKLKGIWISSQLEMIEILHTGPESVNYMCSRELKENFFHLFIHGDTLSFQARYSTSSTHNQVEYVDRYDLKIVRSSDSELVVEPISDFSKAFFWDKPSITLRKKESLTDRTIAFEKLVYHSFYGGSAPYVSLQVDSAQNLYVHFRNEYGDKNLRKGTYSAVLDDDTYNKLIDQLQNAQLRALRFSDVKGADSPITTLIVYFNGKRKHLKSIAPPRVARDLLGFIASQLARYPGLKPTSEVRELEWP